MRLNKAVTLLVGQLLIAFDAGLVDPVLAGTFTHVIQDVLDALKEDGFEAHTAEACALYTQREMKNIINELVDDPVERENLNSLLADATKKLEHIRRAKRARNN